MTFSALNTAASYATKNSPTFTGTVNWASAVLNIATATVATSQTTSSTSYTDLATAGPAVTLVTGTKALVIFTCNLVQGSNNGYAYASFAISGATTQAASDAYSLMAGPATAGVQGPTIRASTAQIFTGLTAGSNTFTVKYRTNINVSYFQDRNITVIDMGS